MNVIETLKDNLVLFVVCFIVFVLSVIITCTHVCLFLFLWFFFRAGLDMIHAQCICYWVNKKKKTNSASDI